MPTCKKCLWYDRCTADNECEHFIPFDDDEYTEEIIDNGRYEFYEEWFDYTDQVDE